MMSDASQQEVIEAASASMGDHERSDSVLGSKIAWPGGVCDGVVTTLFTKQQPVMAR